MPSYLRSIAVFVAWLDLNGSREAQAYEFLKHTLKIDDEVNELQDILGKTLEPDTIDIESLKYLFRNAPDPLGPIVLAAARRALANDLNYPVFDSRDHPVGARDHPEAHPKRRKRNDCV